MNENINIKFMGAFYKREEPDDFHITFNNGYGAYVLLHFYNPMVIVLNHQTIITEKDACIIYRPCTSQDYCALNGNFINDYVRFMTDDEKIFQSYNIPLDELFYLDNIEQLSHHFLSITWILTEHCNTYHKYMKEHFFSILHIFQDNQIFNSPKSRREYHMKKQLMQLRETVAQHPADWNVYKMAKSVFFTRSHFSVVYHKLFGITPHEDLLNFTMEYAKKLLLETEEGVNEISEKCGYNNSENFIRVFKKKNNITPYQYKIKNSK